MIGQFVHGFAANMPQEPLYDICKVDKRPDDLDKVIKELQRTRWNRSLVCPPWFDTTERAILYAKIAREIRNHRFSSCQIDVEYWQRLNRELFGSPKRYSTNLALRAKVLWENDNVRRVLKEMFSPLGDRVADILSDKTPRLSTASEAAENITQAFYALGYPECKCETAAAIKNPIADGTKLLLPSQQQFSDWQIFFQWVGILLRTANSRRIKIGILQQGSISSFGANAALKIMGSLYASRSGEEFCRETFKARWGHIIETLMPIPRLTTVRQLQDVVFILLCTSELQCSESAAEQGAKELIQAAYWPFPAVQDVRLRFAGSHVEWEAFVSLLSFFWASGNPKELLALLLSGHFGTADWAEFSFTESLLATIAKDKFAQLPTTRLLLSK